jgi:uncharacterized protein YlaN (UPF0358 family)
MKIKFLFLSFAAMFLFSNCETSCPAEPAIEPVDVVVVEKPLAPIEMPVTAAMQKMIPYAPSQVVTFLLQNNDNLTYKAKSHEIYKNVTQSQVNGVSRLINFDLVRLAILPNQDSLKCMMLSINSYTKVFEVLIEDNLARKWNYFRVNFDDNNSFLLNKNASNNTVELSNYLTINNIDYENVYKVTNSDNDKLWFSLQNGVLKAELADGRTWNKK